MKRITISFLIVLGITLSAMAASGAPVYGDSPRTSQPTLMVQKWISSDTVLLNEQITVHVNITNISRAYSYNLTIKEPVFNSFIIETTQNYEKYVFVRLGNGANYYYEYTITPTIEGEFRVASTTVDFVDESGFAFVAKSAVISFNVVTEVPAPEIDIQWNTLFTYSLILVLIPIVIYYLNKFINR